MGKPQLSAGLVALLAVAVVVLIVISRAVRIVPQARAGIVERLGRYQRTLNPGLNLLIPLVDRLLPLIDMREQVVSPCRRPGDPRRAGDPLLRA